MTQEQALLEIANAIKLLAGAVGSLSTVLWLMLLFKNMGTSYQALDNIASTLRRLK
jgi:hypothetical protein